MVTLAPNVPLSGLVAAVGAVLYAEGVAVFVQQDREHVHLAGGVTACLGDPLARAESPRRAALRAPAVPR
jgi:hypothetical protein